MIILVPPASGCGHVGVMNIAIPRWYRLRQCFKSVIRTWLDWRCRGDLGQARHCSPGFALTWLRLRLATPNWSVHARAAAWDARSDDA